MFSWMRDLKERTALWWDVYGGCGGIWDDVVDHIDGLIRTTRTEPRLWTSNV